MAKFEVDISGRETIALEPVPVYKGWTIQEGPNAGEEIKPFGGEVFLKVLGPKGGQRFIIDLTAKEAGELAKALVKARKVALSEATPESEANS